MNDCERAPSEVPKVADAVQQALACTPSRILVGRVGPAYRTATALKLREDHAFARDAVDAELDLQGSFGEDRIASLGLFTVQTQARTKKEYLLRPDLGRKFGAGARQLLAANCTPGVDLQVVIGDGLSAAAIAKQALPVLDLLLTLCLERGWRIGQTFAVRYCRVGILNEIGELLDPRVVVLLIGERPGLATAESLSVYLAYRPRPGHTDANRNLISNIHACGIQPEAAAERVMALAETIVQLRSSGVEVKENLPKGIEGENDPELHPT